MELPKIFQVGTHKLQIETAGEEENKKLKEDGYIGRHYLDTNRIVVRPDMPKERILDTIVHEIIHAVTHNYGIELEEKEVITLTTALMCAMRDNKSFYKWLLENL